MTFLLFITFLQDFQERLIFATLFILMVINLIIFGIGQLIAIPVYINILRYRNLYIYDRVIAINGKIYHIKDLKFQIKIINGGVIKSLCIKEKKNNVVGEFYFQFYAYRYFLMDVDLIYNILTQENQITNCSEKVIKNIIQNSVDARETHKSTKYIFLFLVIPFVILIFFSFW